MRPASRPLARACLAAALLTSSLTHAATPESIRAAITKGSAFLVEKEQAALPPATTSSAIWRV